MLVQSDLKPGGRRGAEEIEHLARIEIVGDGEALELFRHEQFGGEGIGDVEREVADAAERIGAEIIERAEVADEDAVGPGVFDQDEEALLAGFLDARGGEKDVGSRGVGAITAGADEFDGVLVAADVFEVGVDFGDAHAEGGGDLVEGAAEDGEEGLIDGGSGGAFFCEGGEAFGG